MDEFPVKCVPIEALRLAVVANSNQCNEITRSAQRTFAQAFVRVVFRTGPAVLVLTFENIVDPMLRLRHQPVVGEWQDTSEPIRTVLPAPGSRFPLNRLPGNRTRPVVGPMHVGMDGANRLLNPLFVDSHESVTL